jgi:hypothetical protein
MHLGLSLTTSGFKIFMFLLQLYTSILSFDMFHAKLRDSRNLGEGMDKCVQGSLIFIKFWLAFFRYMLLRVQIFSETCGQSCQFFSEILKISEKG